MKTIFTTSEVAKICKVAPRTVAKWFDSGRLRGYRIPGSQDRRIPREHLIRFLKEHGLPLGDFEGELKTKVLLVGADIELRAGLIQLMPLSDYVVEFAESSFEAGIIGESLCPNVIIIDFSVGLQESLMIAENIRKVSRYDNTALISLCSDEDNRTGFNRTLFSESFRKPFDVNLLLERIRTLADRFAISK